MSFMEYPQPDACRALMPTPGPPPPGPPSRPMVCHMPKGHEGPHAITRRPRTLDRRWEGDARPVPPEVVAAGERVDAVARALARHLVGLQDANGQPNYTARVAAAAAIAALEPSPAEEAVKRVAALAERLERPGRNLRGNAWRAIAAEGIRAAIAGSVPGVEDLQARVEKLRAALASFAPTPHGGGQR